MKIIYPPLVEQASAYFFGAQASLEQKAATYKALVADKLILPTGTPTKWALKQGLIKDYYEACDLTFSQFLELYPLFKAFPASNFELIDGFWEMDLSLKETLLKSLENGELTYDERIQLEEYLSERQWANAS